MAEDLLLRFAQQGAQRAVQLDELAKSAIEAQRLREIVRASMMRQATMTPPPIPPGGFPPPLPPAEPPPLPRLMGRYPGQLPLVDRSEAARRAVAEATSKYAKTAEQMVQRGSNKGLEIVERMEGEKLKDAALRTLRGMRANPEAIRGAVEGTKAAATEGVAAEAAAAQNVGRLARAMGAGKKAVDLLRVINNAPTLGGQAAARALGFTVKEAPLRILPRVLPTAGLALAGATAMSAGLNVAAGETLKDSQGDAVNLLNEIGFNVERPELGWRDMLRWYSTPEGKGYIDTAMTGEGDPNAMIPASDINQLRVFDPEGEVGTAGSMEDEIDVLRRHNVHQKLMARLARLTEQRAK